MEYGLDRSARCRFQAINQHVPVRSNFAMRLAARTFTCCWKAWLGGYAIGFDSGALRVQASAILLGVNLQKYRAAAKGIGEDVTVADTMIMRI